MPRKSNLDPIIFQDRDIALLRGLFESRVMTTGHAAALYFDDKIHATNKRLQKLKSCGYIGERPRRVFAPSVLFLTRKGLALLQQRGILHEYPAFSLPTLDKRARVSDLRIQHELSVMEVKTAFHSALKSMPSFSIANFNTWPLLNEFTAYHPVSGMEIPVEPDGFMLFHEKNGDGSLFERTFFLEVDRSSETQDRLVTKASCYLDFYRRGGFAVRNGATREDFKKFPFRVLIVLKNAERRNNTAERLLLNTPPILRLAYLSTFEEVSRDPTGAIWIRPLDYRAATEGTPFAPEKQPKTWAYRRQTARERFVEQNVRKQRILASEPAE